MGAFKNSKGFALITVFIISTILFGMIGYTLISANRQGSLRNLLRFSKTTTTTAEAGMEEMIRYIQSYHIDNIGMYWLKRYEKAQGLISDEDVDPETGTPALYNYYPELFEDPRPGHSGEYYLTRAKYFLDFDWLEDIDSDGELEPVKWLDADGDGQVDSDEVNEVTEPVNVRVTDAVVAKLQQLRIGGNETAVDEVTNDIQGAYNQWEYYLLGDDDLFNPNATNDSDLGMLDLMVRELGGLDTGSSTCPDLSDPDIRDKVIMPYDLDQPTTNVKYEGVIAKTAFQIQVDSDSDGTPDTYKVILSAVGYSFNKSVPEDIYDSQIKDKIKLVCPRPKDGEYNIDNGYSQDYYINVIDIDGTNSQLALNNINYKLSLTKRAIRSEFVIPFASDTDQDIQVLLGESSTQTVIDHVSFSDYLVATNDTVCFGYDEELHGPIRGNGNIYFSGSIWDEIYASGNVYDYIWFGPYANQHTGRFRFTDENGVEHEILPFKGNSVNGEAVIDPPYWYDENGNGVQDPGELHSTVKIVHDGPEKKYYLDLNFNNNYDDGVDSVLIYARQQESMDFSKVQEAGNEIANLTYGTDYYFDNPNKTVTLHFLENGKIQVKVGYGHAYILDMPQNAGTDENGNPIPGGVIYARGNVKVFGKINGRVTVYSEKNIYIMNNIEYVHPPITDKTAPPPDYTPDALGLIAHDNIIIHRTAPEHLRVDAAILAQTGWWGIDPYAHWHRYNPNGHVLDFRGSQTFYSADWAPAIVSGNWIKGYETQLQYFDYNLHRMRPPHFPNVGDEIIEREVITDTQPAKKLTGKIKGVQFGRILWREMVNPP